MGQGSLWLTSPDGIAWTTQVAAPTNQLNAVISCGSHFLAVGVNGTILTTDSPPVPTSPAITTNANTPGTSQISPNDPDASDTHTYQVTTAPANGAVVVNAAGLATYTPNANYNGTDSFVVTVTDNCGMSGTVTINVTVNAVVSPNPIIFLSINSSVFNSTTNKAMALTVTTIASIPPTIADIYIALQLPGGTLLVMQPGGSFSTAITPFVSNIQVPNFTGSIFNFTFTGTEPVGNYTWFAALTQPGTLNVIGTLAVAPFSFGP